MAADVRSPDIVLTIDVGLNTRPWAPKWGAWLCEPSADFRCPACGATESAAGEAAVRAFTATIQRVHQAECPARSKSRQSREARCRSKLVK